MHNCQLRFEPACLQAGQQYGATNYAKIFLPFFIQPIFFIIDQSI